MTETISFRMLQADDKADALHDALDGLRDGKATDAFAADPDTFHQIPGSPFAYWVSERVRCLFTDLPAFESDGREARLGDHPSDDFRYLRLSWETLAGLSELTWLPYQKGGEFSKYYYDVHLVVDWDMERQTYRGFSGRPGRSSEHPSNYQYFLRPGLTWPRSTVKGLNVRPLPTGCVFSDKGPTAFVLDDEANELAFLLEIMNSKPFQYLVQLQQGSRAWEVGGIQRTPLSSHLTSDSHELHQIGIECFHPKRELDTANEVSHVFTDPALIQARRPSLGESISQRGEIVHAAAETLARNQAEIDDIAFKLYGISDEDRQAIEFGFSVGGDESEAGNESDEVEEEDETEVVDPLALVDSLISYAVGCAFGRWDARIALNRILAAQLQGPFEPLPVCPPGMLVGTDGLPARPGGIVSEAWMRARPNAITLPEDESVDPATIPDSQYPLRVDWDGIMVDDEGHSDDIVGRLRDVLQLVWKDRADAIEREACEILGVSDSREYMRNPRHFWDKHVNRYSKSRRKAPIYWLLQSAKRSYGIWLYYHRMDADILFKALRNYVDPKLTLERNRLDEQRSALPAAVDAGGRSRRDAERAFERQEALIDEIEQFRKTLERVALLGLTVDHDDGVLLSIAPRRELVPWKRAEKTWNELVAGKYEWSTMSKQMREKGLVRGRRR